MIVDAATRERIGRSPRRAQAYCAAVAALDASLRERGSALVVRRGPPIATALRLARECGARAALWSAPYDAPSLARARALQSSLEEAGFGAQMVHDAPAVSPEETAAARSSDEGTGYRALTPYLAIWNAQPRPRASSAATFVPRAALGASEPLPAPAEFSSGANAADANAADARDAGEAAVLARLRRYLSGPVLEYVSARNVPAGEPTSRLSADLAFGTISARTVLAELDERARDPFLLAEERRALDAFGRALGTRDFFLQLGWYRDRLGEAPLQERMRGFGFARDHVALDAWREGRTGFPLVDAGMRELAATGWMHPRARSIAASFLCFDLGVDWRVGRDAWDALLIEDEPALATGNWQWVAGVGADLAQFPRIYNPRKQARAFDPLGRYVRRWIPELAGVPDSDVFDPASPARRRQLSLPLYGGPSYPAPIVDHETQARAFLQRYGAFVSARAPKPEA